MRKYLITGAGSPLGGALRREINSRGDCWVGVFNIGHGVSFVDSVDKANESIFCDLSNEDGVLQCKEKIGMTPGLNAFVHLAATASFDAKSVQQLNKQMNVNILSAWILADECIRVMSKNEGGRILFAGSVGHKFGGKVNQWGYGASNTC